MFLGVAVLLSMVVLCWGSHAALPMPAPQIKASFDINKAGFMAVLEACHSRILQIQKEDEKRHIMDLDIPHNWTEWVDDELLPTMEKYIYWEPTDDEINAPLHA